MLMTLTDFVRMAKERQGDVHMSDRALGEVLAKLAGYPKPIPSAMISNARYGKASDALAIVIAGAAGVEPGAVLMASRLERETDSTVRKHLERWSITVGKALASVPTKVASAVAAMALGLGLTLLPAPDTQAATVYGGKGRFRPRAA